MGPSGGGGDLEGPQMAWDGFEHPQKHGGLSLMERMKSGSGMDIDSSTTLGISREMQNSIPNMTHSSISARVCGYGGGIVYKRKYPGNNQTKIPEKLQSIPEDESNLKGKQKNEEENEDEGWTAVCSRHNNPRTSRLRSYPSPAGRQGSIPYLQVDKAERSTVNKGNYTTTRNQNLPRPISPSINTRFSPSSSPKSWKDICTIGSNKNVDCKLEYIEPLRDENGKKSAQITEEEIEENVEKWGNTLVGYVLGPKPLYSHIKSMCHKDVETSGKYGVLVEGKWVLLQVLDGR